MLAEVVEKTMLVENLLLTVVGQMLLRETLLHAIALNEIVAFPEIKVNSVILVKTIAVILNFYYGFMRKMRIKSKRVQKL